MPPHRPYRHVLALSSRFAGSNRADFTSQGMNSLREESNEYILYARLLADLHEGVSWEITAKEVLGLDAEQDRAAAYAVWRAETVKAGLLWEGAAPAALPPFE